MLLCGTFLDFLILSRGICIRIYAVVRCFSTIQLISHLENHPSFDFQRHTFPQPTWLMSLSLQRKWQKPYMSMPTPLLHSAFVSPEEDQAISPSRSELLLLHLMHHFLPDPLLNPSIPQSSYLLIIIQRKFLRLPRQLLPFLLCLLLRNLGQFRRLLLRALAARNDISITEFRARDV